MITSRHTEGYNNGYNGLEVVLSVITSRPVLSLTLPLICLEVVLSVITSRPSFLR